MSGKIEFLKSVRIFCDLTEEEIGAILQVLRPRTLQKGQTLFRQGDLGGELFIVESGAMGISVVLDDGQSLEIV